MTKSELVSILTERQPHLLKRDVELALNCILKLMVDELVQGNRIEIRGFGSFDLHCRPPPCVRIVVASNFKKK